MSRWFRMYDDVLDDPKVQLLSDNLFKTWVNLLALASKNNGVLPTPENISFRLRISVQDTQQRLDDLILAGLIDIQPDKTLSPHNWKGRQFPSDGSAARMRKLRSKNKGDVTCDVTRDGPEAEAEAERDNLLVQNLDTAREGRAEPGFEKFSAWKAAARAQPALEGVAEKLRARAEGFGLDVDGILAELRRKRPHKPSGYFVTLCVDALRQRLPHASEAAIKSAFAGNPAARKALLVALTEAAP